MRCLINVNNDASEMDCEIVSVDLEEQEEQEDYDKNCDRWHPDGILLDNMAIGLYMIHGAW